ncbi:hypothetical protein SNE40_004456 [Patella caerulea]|uniref:protein-tyrosine-phosphatase n=1 Tax=Patella caerulea TaxID=87958 RepID=A0AAN8PY34_PATCE
MDLSILHWKIIVIINVIFLSSDTNGARFGYNDKYICHCDNKGPCDSVTGLCSSGCVMGWYGDSCQKENVAFDKFASQSSSYDSEKTPELAVDGQKDTSVYSPTCSHTAIQQSSAFWRVDLGKTYPIRDIRIFVRNNMYGLSRLRGFSLHIIDDKDVQHLCHKDDDTKNLRSEFTIKCNGTRGRHIKISKQGNDVFVNLCEVEVFVCANGTFGPNCTSLCYCEDNETCDELTGYCRRGCLPGWTGRSCDRRCLEGWYGKNCSNDCKKRHCLKSSIFCNPSTGVCEDGCEVGWKGDNCLKKTVLPGELSSGATIGIVIGVILVLLLTLFIVFFIIRQKRRKVQLKVLCGDNEPVIERDDNAVHIDNGDPVYVNEEIRNDTSVELLSRQSRGHMMYNEDEEEEDDEAYLLKQSVEEVDYYNLECQSNKTEIEVDELERFLNEALIGDDNFKNMYEKLPSGIPATFEISQIPENRPKNRFKGYYPYDYNRVILDFLPDKPHSDFINASYIDGFESQNCFIAAQGPTKTTVNDFIRMIWEKKCDKIIMLTKTYEQRKYKCERYWPDNEKEVFGDYELVVKEEKTSCDYTVRKITMKMVGRQKSNRSHTFFHYHFTSWPDHDVPDKTQLLDFLYYTRKYSSQSPIIVHCSAGIGRTGTFIAVDALLKQGDKTHKVDVDKFIYRMRGQRKNMIQTPSQLKFLYEVLIEGFKYGDTSLSCETYITEYTQHGSSLVIGQLSIDKQFNCLKPITDSSIKRNDYWFSVPSRKNSIGYSIIEEKQIDPLEFWKEVKGSGSHVVVQLSDESDVDCYPVSGSQTSIGSLEVKCESVVTVTTDLTSTIVTIGGGEKRTCKGIKLLKMVIPHKDLASLFGNIMKTLIDHVEMHDNGMAPVIVLTSQCVYGGIFCLLRNIIQRINVDDQVEIFNSVSMVRSICPLAFTSKILYKDVHQFALEYITSISDYANLKS